MNLQKPTLRVAMLVAAFMFPANVDADNESFDERIAPILARHCIECHNASERSGGLELMSREGAHVGGESGPVIAAGDPDGSLLWQHVRDDVMPPEENLSAAAKDALREWITAGAVWGESPIDVFRISSPDRAGYDWWALQPLQSSPLPPAVDGFGQNAIDTFVAVKLAERQLQPSPPASRRDLIRRLSYQLTGLPPTPEAVLEFERDTAADAYVRLVERLLASPHYGERWTRHWLDVARFGESQGFERDKLRTNSWRYRDWLIRSFNEDLPYDLFARQQLAGDVLPELEQRSIAATGFLVAGPYDEVGQSQQSDAMKAVVRQDELEDYVSTVSQTFLGLTVNCARCHDHKFDPIYQREYYQLAAALSGVRHGQPEIAVDEQAASAARAAEQRARILRERLQELEAPLRERILARKRETVPIVRVPSPIARWEFDGDLQDAIGGLHGQLHGGAYIKDGWLQLDGQSFVTTASLAQDLTEKTLEALVHLHTVDQGGGGVLGVQSLDGVTFDAIVYGEKDRRRWMAGSDGYRRTQTFDGPEQESQRAVVCLVFQADGTIAFYRDGQPYGEAYVGPEPVTFAREKSQVLFGLRHLPPGGNRFFTGSLDWARLYDRALTHEEVAASAGVRDFVTQDELRQEMKEEEKAQHERLTFEIEQLREQRERWFASQTYAVAAEAPGESHLLLRGNPAAKGPVVRPAGLAAVRGVDSDFALVPTAADSPRRVALANWIADPRNPLFSRVIVNRIWHYHFGNGIVATPNDFGFNGSLPSHPELLDWLAAELVRSGWSLKHLQRLIVTSQTYQQSSAIRAEALEVDAGNRWLWRMSPRRLEAEAIRDSLLVIAGELNGELYGPGFHDFRTFVFNSQFYEMRDPVGATFHRRSLYRTWVRSGRSTLLDVFDCPDPSAKAPARAETTTPLQALALLNNSFVFRMADHFADRLAAECGNDPTAQIDRLHHLLLARAATGQEQQEARAFVREHGLAALCRVLFNCNEFVYLH